MSKFIARCPGGEQTQTKLQQSRKGEAEASDPGTTGKRAEEADPKLGAHGSLTERTDQSELARERQGNIPEAEQKQSPSTAEGPGKSGPGDSTLRAGTALHAARDRARSPGRKRMLPQRPERPWR